MTNVPSVNAQREGVANRRLVDKSFAQLASGERITKAADDAAGLALSKGMDMHMRSASQANRNANDAISLIQIAEGSFNELNTIMTRLRELAITSASDSIGDEERVMINNEVTQLRKEMDRITESTRWGTRKLLNAEGGSFEFQVGLFNTKDQDRIKVSLKDIDTRTETLGISSMDFSNKEGARKALGKIDQAQNHVGERRANIGAIQNRLNSSMDNLNVQRENMAAARSQIGDADVAEASSQVVKGKIIAQAGTATLSQANQSQGVALKLIS